jgi:hypothetical protein
MRLKRIKRDQYMGDQERFKKGFKNPKGKLKVRSRGFKMGKGIQVEELREFILCL